MLEQANPLVMFFQAFITQAVVYFVVVGLIFLVVWRWGEERFRGSRIQSKKRFNQKQLVFEVKNTFATLAIGTVSAVGISLLYASGMTRLSSDASAFTWWGVIASFIGFLLFNDLWFYGWHRLLHHPTLFRHVHAVHHKSVDVNPFSAYSFHPFEAFILGVAVFPVLFIVPIYLPVLGVLQVVGLMNNIMSHLGYEFLPRWYATIPPFRWMNTATFHSLHHTKLNGNYGLFFRFWDRALGTEVPEYEETFLKRGAALQHSSTNEPAG